MTSKKIVQIFNFVWKLLKTVLKVSTREKPFIYLRYSRWLIDAIILSNELTVYSNIFIIYQKWLKFDLKGDCDHENALPAMGIKEFQKSIKVTKTRNFRINIVSKTVKQKHNLLQAPLLKLEKCENNLWNNYPAWLSRLN